MDEDASSYGVNSLKGLSDPQDGPPDTPTSVSPESKIILLGPPPDDLPCEPEPEITLICLECKGMTQTFQGFFRLMTSGYLHEHLKWSHEDITLAPPMVHGIHTHGNKAPPTPPMNRNNSQELPPPGGGCMLCGHVLQSPRANQRGFEIIHPSTFHRFDRSRLGNVFHHISFHAIIYNRQGQQIENPFEDRTRSRIYPNSRLLVTETLDWMAQENVQVDGLRVMRDDEEILTMPYHIPLWCLLPKPSHFKNIFSTESRR